MMDNDDNLKDYLGIPRLKLPWYPTIDQELCTSCGICVSACKHGAYEFDDNNRAVVAHPFYCEVFCESCKFQCPVGAISFPNRGEFKSIIKELRVFYPPTN